MESEGVDGAKGVELEQLREQAGPVVAFLLSFRSFIRLVLLEVWVGAAFTIGHLSELVEWDDTTVDKKCKPAGVCKINN